MKRSLLSVLCFLTIQALHAQLVNDSVSTAAGYSNQSYYSLLNGEVANVDNNNWDLAFDASSFGSSIHINDHAGSLLYVYPNGDTSDWSTLDTAGISSWTPLYNSDYSWSVGAFEQTLDEGDPTDLGWGVYSTITHAVTGDSIYVFKLASGNWKKLWIEDLAGGSYHFRYANLDGSSEVSASLDKANYNGRNFGYYSIQDGKTVNREPVSSSWDLLFTKYTAALGPGSYYGVTGVLQNYEVTAAKAYPVNDPFTYSSFGSHNLEENINSIGYDWKYFDMSEFKYVIEDSLCYFVKDVPGNIWRVTFTGFGGSSTGNIVFAKELISQVGIEENEIATTFQLYPNPASGSVGLIYNSKENSNLVNVYTLTGKQVLQKTFNGSGFRQETLKLEGIAPGVYIMTFTSGAEQQTKKLIIQ